MDLQAFLQNESNYHFLQRQNNEDYDQWNNCYGFDEEPYAVWVQDKKSKDIQNRWILVVAFNDNHVLEVHYDQLKDYASLRPYLKDKSNEDKAKCKSD